MRLKARKNSEILEPNSVSGVIASLVRSMVTVSNTIITSFPIIQCLQDKKKLPIDFKALVEVFIGRYLRLSTFSLLPILL